ncbi:sugar phosphate isomerase/epimerase family protein [Corynebacterium choanae]|uniref:D-tagatose 3-epimerase n=1 Tax=Corynebacterium choanae TaxID=1862358 RepID=A0A3G6J5L3_9CORY|nr:sugar phosphate isomerase/epimerase family protein [Corynebacterium choanae]AZA13226.1 D-tagatose 3-epimerase [Corynebacterium choanae]
MTREHHQLQPFEQQRVTIRENFQRFKEQHPEALCAPLNLSWSNWGFGLESLAQSAKRLADAGLQFIELHGNHYGDRIGYQPQETLRILADHGLTVSGVCGMFSADNDLSSNNPFARQQALDYIARELDFLGEVGGDYLLVVPAAVGRPQPYDQYEQQRSTQTLALALEWFDRQHVVAAIEPIRSAEVSIVHTVDEALAYIGELGNHEMLGINGDLYHMLTEEDSIPDALLRAGDRLTNLHLADTNRRALGTGFLDIDSIIMTLYMMGYNRPGKYVTPEPLGPAADPYVARNGVTDCKQLDELVQQTVSYFRQREAIVREG